MSSLNRLSARFLIVVCVLALTTGTAMAALNVDHHGLTVDSSDHRACLGCHDGTIGPDVDVATKGCSQGLLTSHPVNMVYPPVGKERSFHDAAAIEAKGMELADGKVTCLTCHNLRKGLPMHLAVSNIRSQLCMACHKR